jgi:hypothetical protein
MSSARVLRDAEPHPTMLVVATAIAFLSLPLAAMAGCLGYLELDYSLAPRDLTGFNLGPAWPIACVLGPACAWGAYMLGARKLPWLFMVGPFLFDAAGLVTMLDAIVHH